ncbi:PhoH family protein [Salidesulfovibrio onnuriiensis]|uniref:PhoH family protein n=1 Tax=Salidesulfovibrio onnuriiensis TaxID=2583823 RepID=UPI0011CBE11E|nr:PhoH family protein [Salidesulfovibrio onnuriiensis]
MVNHKLEFEDNELARQLFGPQETHLRLIAERFGLKIESRGNKAIVTSLEDDKESVDLASRVMTQLYGMLRAGKKIHPQDVDLACRILDREPGANIGKVFQRDVSAGSPKKGVVPKTINQRTYLDAIREKDMTFGIGPAGTGKTYLAVAMAVGALLRREVKRIVLTRPAVEAGEKLGFLPGDLVEKINPYLRPLYDSLHAMLDFEKVKEYMETGVIEVAPLAFMRGRTINDAFIILDEAQNTTPEQMKMFLTRLGFGSRAVVTGDITQIDLPQHSRSGLLHAMKVLAKVEGIEFVTFDDQDVIRHPLVGRIVKAYDRDSGGK